MKRIVIVAMCLSTMQCLAQSTAPVDIKTLKAKYEQGLAAIQEETNKALTNSVQGYADALKALGQKLQGAGDLDGILAVKKEAERFGNEKAIPEGAVVADCVALKDLQLKWQKRPDAIDISKSKKLVALSRSHIAALEEVKKQLTIQGKVDEAVEAKNEIERVRTSAEVTAAEFVLTNAGIDLAAKSSTVATVLPPTRTDPLASLRGSLVLYYSFDRDEKGFGKNDKVKISDKSGKRNNGVANDAKWTAKGKRGGGVEFDGAGSYVEAECRGLPTGDKPRTLGLWIYPEADDCHMLLIGYGNSKKPDDFFGMFRYMTNDRVPINRRRLVLAQPGGADVGPSEYVDTFKWTHLAVVYDGTVGTLFVNGEKRSSDKRMFDTANTSFFIGGVPAENSCWANGRFDEVMLFDRALTDKEVKQIYDAQK